MDEYIFHKLCIRAVLSTCVASAKDDLPCEVLPLLEASSPHACTVSLMRAVPSVIIVMLHLPIQGRIKIVKPLNSDTKFSELILIISISNFHKALMTL